MESTVMFIVQRELMMIALVFIFGLIGMKLAVWWKIPDIAIFLIIGILVGPSVLGWISEPNDSVANQFIIVLGSILILYDGGRAIPLAGMKKIGITVSMLAVPGVFVTAGVMTAAVHYLMDMPWLYALLLSSVIASTDPATLIPVFKQVKIRDKVRETVESESAFNDATGSILTFTVLAIVMDHQEVSFLGGLKEFVVEAGGGLLIGLAVGAIGLLLKSEHRYGVFRSHPHITGFVTAIGAYLIAGFSHASGFMATFTAGLVAGSPHVFRIRIAEETHRRLDRFGETATLLLRTLIFILLGSQVHPADLIELGWQGLLVIAIFIFVARPLTVLVCALPDRRAKWTWRELLFMCWVRETGVIPAALSGMIAVTGILHADSIAAVTFLAIFVTIVLQAGTTAFVARKLKILKE